MKPEVLRAGRPWPGSWPGSCVREGPGLPPRLFFPRCRCPVLHTPPRLMLHPQFHIPGRRAHSLGLRAEPVVITGPRWGGLRPEGRCGYQPPASALRTSGPWESQGRVVPPCQGPAGKLTTCGSVAGEAEGPVSLQALRTQEEGAMPWFSQRAHRRTDTTVLHTASQVDLRKEVTFVFHPFILKVTERRCRKQGCSFADSALRATKSRAAQSQSQGVHLEPPHGSSDQEPGPHLGPPHGSRDHLLPLFQVHEQRAGSEMEWLSLEPGPIWDATCAGKHSSGRRVALSHRRASPSWAGSLCETWGRVTGSARAWHPDPELI